MNSGDFTESSVKSPKGIVCSPWLTQLKYTEEALLQNHALNKGLMGESASLRYIPKKVLMEVLHSKFTHRTRGLPRGQTLRVDPATNNPLETLTIFLLGFHVGFIQVIKPLGPMEQFTLFLLGFHLGLYQF